MTATAVFASRNRRTERVYQFPDGIGREEVADFIVRWHAPAYYLVSPWTRLPPDALWAQLEEDTGGKAAVRVDFS